MPELHHALAGNAAAPRPRWNRRFRRALRRAATATATVALAGGLAASPALGAMPDVRTVPSPSPAAMVMVDGSALAFDERGNVTGSPNFGSLAGHRLNQPISAAATTPDGRGYWLVARDGGVFSFGTAQFAGSLANIRLNQPVVAMAGTPSGRGYWMAASDGGVFALGDARFLGGLGHLRLNQPIVSMAATPTGRGYWLAASDGGVFAFGDAAFHGSAAGSGGTFQEIVAAPGGSGYWLVGSNGLVRGFGSAGTAQIGVPAGQQVVGAAGQGATLKLGLATTVRPGDLAVCPVAGPHHFIDSWGARRSGGRAHIGVDMMAARGVPAVAPVSGVVTHRGNTLGGLSYHLNGDDGNYYYGTHLSAYGASGRVSAGTVIGYVGDTGNAAGMPHLHFEIHVGGRGNPINPYAKVRAVC
jgi:hypothetical protein